MLTLSTSTIITSQYLLYPHINKWQSVALYKWRYQDNFLINSNESYPIFLYSGRQYITGNFFLTEKALDVNTACQSVHRSEMEKNAAQE